MQRAIARITPGRALAAVLVCFALLAGAVLSLTPPWEANDEPYHVENVETLVSGHWYRITRHTGLESHQAPLYYLLLAGYQELARTPVMHLDEPFRPVTGANANHRHGLFEHYLPRDGIVQRQLDVLRLPSIVFGLLTILFTFVAARFVSDDRWTPVVAAAIVAMVPRFVFLSGVVNNDNLSDALGGAALAAALAMQCRPPSGRRARLAAAAGIGLLAGALVLSKLTAALVAPGLLLAVVPVARDRREAVWLASAFLGAAVLVSGWWFVQNQVRYGDPLAASATTAHFRQIFPGLLNVAGPFTRIFDQIPRNLYKSFWYDSGWSQFAWHWFWYLPFWGLAALGLAGLARRGERRHGAAGRPLVTCAVVAVGALLIVWVLGLQTNTQEGRLAFVGLPAIGLLLAVGYERLKLAIGWRFVLPAIGLIGTVIAIHYNVIVPYSG